MTQEAKILFMNGPNLGHLGKRDVHIYGTDSMTDVLSQASEMSYQGQKIQAELFQSNHEGEIIDRLEQAREDFLQGKILGVVLNAGAFTHTSLALADCLSWIKVPFVEVHISNILARSQAASSAADALRGQSLFAASSLGVISGFGIDSYLLAVEALIRYTNKTTLQK